TVGAVGSADFRSLVPVQAEPAQRVEQGQIALLAVALRVGVLDAEDERAPGVASVSPVEQRGADHSHMRSAGRRRAEPDPHARCGHDFPLRTTGLVRVPIPSMVTETVSPSSMGPTPAGVPVRMRSPGSNVMTAEIHSTMAPTSWIISEVRLSCLTSPLTSVRSARSDGSTSVTIHGPTGQKLS